ncbi:hypothetical protein SEA_EUGENEKRABS_41 [Microbacterium phage EugeneKrabs]|nr:hypothetical protein SEA_EUGENEKRABS_41 [Microbacterium phage EugeneKrabs]
MAFWDDLIRNITGQSNTPEQKPASPARKAVAPVERGSQSGSIKPTLMGGGGGSGSLRAFSVPTQSNPDEDTSSRRSGRTGGGSFDQPAPTGLEQIHQAKKPIDTEGNLLEQMGQGMINQGVDETKKGEDWLAWWITEPVNNPAEFFQPVQGASDRVENIKQEEELRQSFQPAEFTVRQLSQEEWDALDLKTQQAITANYALYQATQADKGMEPGEREEGYDDLVSKIFGEDGGSDTYAPNTIRVLKELGYMNEQNDLDYFLNGGAILSEDELLNGKGNEARLSVLDELQNSSTWQNSNLVPMLEQGTSLIESLRQGDALSADTLRLAGISPLAMYDIDPERADALNGLMQGMASRDVWAAFETDPEASASFKADFDHITNGMDPTLVARYFRESYPQYFQNAAFGDANSYMTPDEFYANWLSS